MSGWEPVLTGLVQDRGGSLIRYAWLLCRDQSDAEDLVQDALVRVFAGGRPPSARGSVDHGEVEHAEAYVRRTILNLYLDGYRRRRRWEALRRLVGLQGSIVGPEQASPQRLDVYQALAALPPRQRACVVLRFYDDLTVVEIAEVLAITSGTVKRHLHDANAALAASLSPTLEVESS